ncbi:hypothetical protein EGW08_005576 [Elysia chlorotica]|uniref:C-type lectin domain-containing protein n=1 Tax=Elysia chlorotica TaxID=188477 RepID=A0A3S0ZZ90_ELYCH|nr:hypothetical protein EGW08_005576 [Elysia chlorotica]
MKFISLAAFCFSVLATQVSSISVEDCPRTLSRDVYLQVFREFCYEFVLYRDLEFDTAKDDCRSRGGDLVKIFDQATQDFLYRQLRETYGQKDEVWIGLTDKNSEDKWEWMDGSIPEFTNWAPGQPGVVHGLEDCAALDPSDGGRWHDYKCEDLFIFVDAGHRYICQYKSNYRPPQTTTERIQVTDSSPSNTETTMTNPPQSTTMTNPPQSTTMTNPPQSTTMINPPQSTTMTNPPQSTTMTNPPQSTTMTNPPQSTTMTNPPQSTTITNPPQPTTQPPQPTTQPPQPTTQPPQPTTQPTTQPPQPTTQPTTQPPQPTTQPTTQPPQPTTTVPTTATSTVKPDACPPNVCTLDCGLDGYKSDENGCLLCECFV